MYYRFALAVGQLQARVAERRKAALGTHRWWLWVLAWIPLYVLTSWLFDLPCLLPGNRKEPVCRG